MVTQNGMNSIINITDIKQETWEVLSKDSSTATWFQTYSAYRFFISLPFIETFGYGLESGDGLRAVVIGFIQKEGGKVKQFLSRRAIINGGPLLANDITEEELSLLLSTLKKQLSGKVIYIETRNYHDYSRYRSVFEQHGFIYEPHYDVIVDTETPDVVKTHMGKSRVRDVNTSLKKGAVLIDNPTEDEVRSFYTILENLYRTKVKTPLFPLSFFLQLWQMQFAKFILVKYQDGIVGGTVLVYDSNVVYEWFACGKDGIIKNVYPSTVATYQGVFFAAENGFKRFDMMGAGSPGDGGYGVREFKLKFGGKLVEYGRYKCICNQLLYKIGVLGVQLLKKIK